MVDLTPHNTLRLPARARQLYTITSPDDIQSLLNQGVFQGKYFVTGLGANVLFRSDFPGSVIRVRIPGREIVSQTDQHVQLKIGAGQDWPGVVDWAVANNLAGIENLALVPGLAGSAPYQNIAAYGQSLDETFVSLRAVNLKTGQVEEFDKKACAFRYRDSVFKSKLRHQYLITDLTLQLSKVSQGLKTNYYSRYESVESELQKFAAPPYTIHDVYQAVVNLRRVKLPDWTQTGTAGSFFKNPFVTKPQLAELQSRLDQLQFYPTTGMDYPHPDDPVFDHTKYVKIPAGRLLDELGWKGKRVGNVGTFAKHALVIVTYPGATGQEVYEFTQNMRADVQKNFGVNLEYEVVLVP